MCDTVTVIQEENGEVFILGTDLSINIYLAFGKNVNMHIFQSFELFLNTETCKKKKVQVK